MSAYQIGERVWAHCDGAWFPAKVVVGEVYGLTAVEPGLTVIKYYEDNAEGDVSLDIVGNDALAPYEESSEKAVTLDPKIQAAMELCAADTDALPLRASPVVVGSKRARGEEDAASAKHHRREKAVDSDAAHAHTAERAAPRSAKGVVITQIQTELIAATNSNNVIAARRALLKLGTEKMTYSVLRETLIGITVANLLALDAFRPVHPLARAIVCDWAKKLPEETISAIRREISASTE